VVLACTFFTPLSQLGERSGDRENTSARLAPRVPRNLTCVVPSRMFPYMQSADSVLLIRPSHFGFNTQTASSNSFQSDVREINPDEIQRLALVEFDAMVKTLREKGVRVLAIDDTPTPAKPDAIFPNNWVTFHPDGTVVLYPMHAINRRSERRKDILETVSESYEVRRTIDISGFEQQGKFLEGTGSIVFDHLHMNAFACRSPRTDADLLKSLTATLGCTPVMFDAVDRNGIQIYHTNVMMCIGTGFAVVCLESIKGSSSAKNVADALSGRIIIDISFDQMNCFAGNMLELKGPTDKNLLVVSTTAWNSLTGTQQNQLADLCDVVLISIPAIERVGGGSVRCMIAEIFLPGVNL